MLSTGSNIGVTEEKKKKRKHCTNSTHRTMINFFPVELIFCKVCCGVNTVLGVFVVIILEIRKINNTQPSQKYNAA